MIDKKNLIQTAEYICKSLQTDVNTKRNIKRVIMCAKTKKKKRSCCALQIELMGKKSFEIFYKSSPKYLYNCQERIIDTKNQFLC